VQAGLSFAFQPLEVVRQSGVSASPQLNRTETMPEVLRTPLH
jgi:hypothetical protein